MRRVMMLALACVLLIAPSLWAQAMDVRKGSIELLILADSGGATWVTDVDLVQYDGYWTGGKFTVIDDDAAAADSVVDITGFDAGQDSLIFVAFGEVLAKTDSCLLYLNLDANPYIKIPDWEIDSASVDTSETFRVTPGASITSSFLITAGDNQDSVDSKIYLDIALSKQLGNNAGWMRLDSITYAEQDTVVYKAWGAVQAHWFRFVVDPVEAPFSASHTAIFYGKVTTDK